MRHIPLTALRSFEAAGRLKSVSKAALELNVTPGAVSKQLRLLEEALEVQLFVRGKEGLVLAPEAVELHDRVSVSFDGLTHALEDFQLGEVAGQIILHCMPAFSSQWLVPRLNRFLERFPDVTVNVLSTDLPFIEPAANSDIAIVFGRPNWRNAEVSLLKRVEFFPVCSPRILQTATLRTSDLARFTLLDGFGISHWHNWFALKNAPYPRRARHIHFADYNQNLAAARSGLGFAMGDNVTAEADLRTGALVRPLSGALQSDKNAYYVLLPTLREPSEATVAFHQWLLDEARKTAAPPY